MVITDWSMGEPRLFQAIDLALRAGPGIAVQHRHPGVTDRVFCEEGRRLAALCRRFEAPFFVNRRLDIAMLLNAHLHLPVEGIWPADARAHLGEERLISVAVHNAAEAARAAGADFALVSPVFEPGSKVDDTRPTLGRAGYEGLAARLGCPAFALGGVTAARVLELGRAPGAAVISAVLHAPSPREAAAQLLGAM